eukprot:10657549-Alexandrium_andersonii.AAC.1
MSASLVGSEMCIRDSPASHLGPPASVDAEPRTSAFRPAGLMGPTPLPVSYTHLTLPTICSV